MLLMYAIAYTVAKLCTVNYSSLMCHIFNMHTDIYHTYVPLICRLNRLACATIYFVAEDMLQLHDLDMLLLIQA